MARIPEPIREAVGDSRHGLRWAMRVLQHAARAKGEPEPTRDVWRWTKQKYRVRAVVLMLINAALFAGLGCFTFWLRTGLYNPFATQQYWHRWWAAFDPTREQQITLIDFLIYPIPVDQVPLMMVIVGLVLASLTAIPILVSMLYRFPFSLIFTAIICFVAVVPWLAIVVTICCYLARWRPLQFSFRYATALVSMLPLVVYYGGATRNASISVYLPPMEMAKLYLPWVLALIAACVVMAIVLLIARLVNYRPGAIAPLLAVMFTVPVVLFEAEVGRDELYYRLLEDRFGPGSKSHFVDYLDLDKVLEQAAWEPFQYSDDPNASLQSVMEQIRIGLQIRLASGRRERGVVASFLGGEFARQQHEIIEACRDFRRRFPHSRYVPNALYLEGRARDMRIDQNLTLFQDTLIVRHYQDFPNAASKPVWRELGDRFPDAALTAVAHLHLAILEARQGKVDEAIELLAGLARRFEDHRKDEAPPTRLAGWRGFLAKRPASSSLDVDQSAVVEKGRKLRHLLVNNRDPDQNDLALRRLLSFDPRHPNYRRNLERLLEEIPTRHPRTRLADNVEVLIATAEPSLVGRIQQLEACIKKLPPRSDAWPRACFELGVVYQRDNLPAKARAAFEKVLRPEVLRHHQDSPWVSEVRRRLAAMEVSARPASG